MAPTTIAKLRESLIERKRVLITVKTYPLPSRTYDELVCTAGVLEDRSWIRIYPVPFRFLKNNQQYKKFQWIELDLVKNTNDFRPESYRPLNLDLSDAVSRGSISTHDNWRERKKYCCPEEKVYTSLDKLIDDAKNPEVMKPLATFRPKQILNFEVEADEREWKEEWQSLRNQTSLFEGVDWLDRHSPIRKLPYKFKYHFQDVNGREAHLMIEDWEIGALYWNCLQLSKGDEQAAIAKVRAKYYEEFVQKEKDLHLFLGTTMQWHKRSSNPFVIAGVFYPPADPQLDLFSAG